MTRLKVLAPILALALAGAAAPPPLQGYLGDAGPDTIRILPPAPTAGTTRYEADRTTFLATRSLKDSPRWALAVNDIPEGQIRRDLACAVGVELTDQNAPRTALLLKRMRIDLRRATDRPKQLYKRQRPFMVDDGPICEHDDYLASSPDYPSGHNTFSWGVGLVLAELAPDRASDILVRARAFGESRIVCGVHNLSAAEAGRTNASAVVAVLHSSPGFLADLAAARKEIAAARKAGPAPDPAACAAEIALTAKTPY